MYSSANNIPFLIQWEGKIPEGVENNNVVSNVDILPTLMGLTGTDFVDINSGVEVEPGEKTISLLEEIISLIHK